MRTERFKILLLFSLFLTMVSVGLTYYHHRESENAATAAMHSQQVLIQLEELVAQLHDLETCQRGYLITGLQQYVDGTDSMKHKIMISIQLLEDDEHNNIDHHTTINTALRNLVKRKIDFVDSAIYVHDVISREAAFDLIKTNRGKSLMDQIKSSVNVVKAKEKKLLDRRLARLERQYRVNDAVRYSSLIIIGLISYMALGDIIKKNKKNSELMTQLQYLNQNLEQKVLSRTDELRKQNELEEELNHALQKKIYELNEINESLQIRNASTEHALIEIRDLYDNAPCGYHSTNHNGVFIRMNKTELGWLGYSKDEVIGEMTFRTMIPAHQHARFEQVFRELKEKGFVDSAEFDLIRKDGTSFPVLITSTAIFDENGVYRSNRSTVFNLSRRKELEQRIIESNLKLIKLNEEKNTFLGIAAHDLKSPLNNIAGLLNLFRYDQNPLSVEQHEYLDQIAHASNRMKTLIENLLDVNRIETGKNDVRIEKISTRKFFKEITLIHQQLADPKQIKIKMTMDEPLEAFFVADANILRQILDNLLSNAVKFSQPSSTVHLQITTTRESTKIAVIDEGPGLTEQDKEKLFMRFQKLSARPTAGENSTGLGLYIVKELVNLLGGTIEVESEVNKGTSFRVELPVRSAA